ncbi:phosphodiester glycosidase family protein [Zhaonella formicivorans]|jgi:exopolysaccharide biosynthesis protein|uniref:phosphodiester glycosidase family protein n=1 Tax=Zhaonella formicivorans TaxID=2528593 RepID=UPI001D1108AD|nr:phosphodiester glycosidase family protein [Zhaonella formicivorans]
MAKRRRIFWVSSITTVVFTLTLSFNAWAGNYSGSPGSGQEAVKPTLKVEEERVLAPGVKYLRVSGSTAGREPLFVNVVEANLSKKDVEVRPVLAADGITGKENLSSIAARTGAVAAVNGSFFSTTSPYLPVGNLVIDGKYLALSEMLRTSMGIFKNGSVKFGYFRPGMMLRISGVEQEISITNVNRLASAQDVVLYTPHWGATAGTGQGEDLVSLVRGSDGRLVVQERAAGTISIPPNGYALRLPSELAGAFWTGGVVELKAATDSYWSGVKHLLTSGPLLVENGEPVFQAVAEGFTGTVLERNPRTAVGVTKDGKMLLAVVDGRSEKSVGVTLEELAYIMTDLGAYQAMGLDGGGSTEMWVQGKIVNQPSGGSERPLNNGLVVLTGIPVYLDGDRLFFDVPPQLINGRTLVPFRRIFEALGAQVQYDAATRMVTAVKEGRTVQFTGGAKQALVNGETVALDVPAREINGRTLVPLRFAGTALGVEVVWTKDATVEIHTK